MKFPYQKQPDYRYPNRPWISRPWIPVRLFHNNEKINIFALVDSGADTCLFHNSVGKALGIEVEAGDKETFYGIEGSGTSVYFHYLELQIEGSEEKIKIKAGFVDSKSVSAILGQEHFFDNFKIVFEKNKESVEIIPIKK